MAALVKEYAVNQRKAVAIVARKHLVREFSEKIRFIRDHAKLFTVDSSTMDDLFIVYAAMFSGQGCMILSRDVMENHGAKLKDHRLHSLYRKWIRSRRITLVDVLPNGRVVVTVRSLFFFVSHKFVLKSS